MRNRIQFLDQLKSAAVELSDALDRLHPPENVFVYNPLNYARKAYFKYIDDWANSPIEALFLGMNPGPFGMLQSGIPFGDLPSVKSFLRISEGVLLPSLQHPRRPIEGYDCRRREVSGTRLWGFFSDCFQEPEAFFKNYFVINYCPLGFLNERGANLTPDKIPKGFRKIVEGFCDVHLQNIVPAFRARAHVGIGGYATKVFSPTISRSERSYLASPKPS